MKRKLTFILFCIYFTCLLLYIKPTITLYEVVGVDVSRYQGNIDWEIISSQNFSFAFIKATEGSNHVDKYFSTNWENVSKTSVLAAPYHFLSYDSSGITQAENFISCVGKKSQMLPPVVDVEFYGAYYNTGVIHFLNADYDLATESFKKAIQIDNTKIEAKINMELSIKKYQTEVKQAQSEAIPAAEAKEKLPDMEDALFEHIKEQDKKQWKNSEQNQDIDYSQDY